VLDCWFYCLGVRAVVACGRPCKEDHAATRAHLAASVASSSCVTAPRSRMTRPSSRSGHQGLRWKRAPESDNQIKSRAVNRAVISRRSVRKPGRAAAICCAPERMAPASRGGRNSGRESHGVVIVAGGGYRALSSSRTRGRGGDDMVSAAADGHTATAWRQPTGRGDSRGGSDRPRPRAHRSRSRAVPDPDLFE
jgi:hypothetical protein